MPTKRDLEKRLHRLEKRHRRRNSSPPEGGELTDEQKAQIEGIVASLSDDERAELERLNAQIEEAPDDAETDEFGITDAECKYYDVLTGGYNEP